MIEGARSVRQIAKTWHTSFGSTPDNLARKLQPRNSLQRLHSNTNTTSRLPPIASPSPSTPSSLRGSYGSRFAVSAPPLLFTLSPVARSFADAPGTHLHTFADVRVSPSPIIHITYRVPESSPPLGLRHSSLCRRDEDARCAVLLVSRPPPDYVARLPREIRRPHSISPILAPRDARERRKSIEADRVTSR